MTPPRDLPLCDHPGCGERAPFGFGRPGWVPALATCGAHRDWALARRVGTPAPAPERKAERPRRVTKSDLWGRS